MSDVSDKIGTLRELEKPGWESALQKVKEALRIAEKMQETLATGSEDGSAARVPVPSFVLIGGPGTGKTAIACLIGKILHEAGILKRGHTALTTIEELSSSYVSGISEATMRKADEAEEGVLLIDGVGLHCYKTDAEKHVFSTLCEVLSDPARHLSIILTGYEDLGELFHFDPGLRRRLGDNIIEIDDFSPEVLTGILMDTLQSKGYQIDPALTEVREADDGTSYPPLRCLTEHICRIFSPMRFGNARGIKVLCACAESKANGDQITQECFYGAMNGLITAEWFEPVNTDEADSMSGHPDHAEKMKPIYYEENDKSIPLYDDGDAGEKREFTLADVDENIEFAFLKFYLQFPSFLIGQEEECRNVLRTPIVIVGESGSGKTVLAGKLAELYYSNELIESPDPVVIDAITLESVFEGGSEKIAAELIRRAQEMKSMLFVDEVHALLNHKKIDGVGILKKIIAAASDKDRPFLLCFAVYPEWLEALLGLEPDLRQRVRIINL